MSLIRILLIEDNPSDAQLIGVMLGREKIFGHALTVAHRLADGLAQIAQNKFDVVLTDLGLPDSQGLATFAALHQAAPHVPVIVLTQRGDMDTALAAIQGGAQDFLPKSDLSGLLLARTIRYAIERNEAEKVLGAKEEMLRLFIRHTPAAIAVLDTNLRYLQVSERWYKDYHHEGKDIIGKLHYELFPDLPEQWKEGHRRVLAGAVEKCDEDKGRVRPDGSFDWLQWELHPWHKSNGEVGGLIFFIQIITERKQREAEREELILELKEALTKVKTLSGLLPICACCKKVRDDGGYWNQIETYVAQHSDASFSHGFCPECAIKTLESAGVPVSDRLRKAGQSE